MLATLKIPNVLRISNVIKWYSHKKGISRVGHLHLFLSSKKLYFLHDFLKSPKHWLLGQRMRFECILRELAKKQLTNLKSRITTSRIRVHQTGTSGRSKYRLASFRKKMGGEDPKSSLETKFVTLGQIASSALPNCY